MFAGICLEGNGEISVGSTAGGCLEPWRLVFSASRMQCFSCHPSRKLCFSLVIPYKELCDLRA